MQFWHCNRGLKTARGSSRWLLSDVMRLSSAALLNRPLLPAALTVGHVALGYRFLSVKNESYTELGNLVRTYAQMDTMPLPALVKDRPRLSFECTMHFGHILLTIRFLSFHNFARGLRGTVKICNDRLSPNCSKPPDGPGSIKGHQARAGRAKASVLDGVSLPNSRLRSAQQTRFGLLSEEEGDLCARLLLASASRLQKSDDAREQHRILATEIQQDCRAR